MFKIKYVATPGSFKEFKKMQEIDLDKITLIKIINRLIERLEQIEREKGVNP